MTEQYLYGDSLRVAITDGLGSPLSSCEYTDATGSWQRGLLPRASAIAGTTPFPRFGNPLLFPVAGRSYAQGQLGRAVWQGNTMGMPLHGIGYEGPWRRTDGGPADRLITQWHHTPHDADAWPFPCTVTQAWRIPHERTLHHEFRVSNQHLHEPMPIACGFHPFFVLPSPWQKLFMKIPARAQWTVDGAGLAAAPQPCASTLRPLTDPFLHNGIVGDLTGEEAAILDDKGRALLRIRWDGKVFPYLVFWAQPQLNVICIEPWMALPNALARPEALTLVAPNATFCSFMEMSWHPENEEGA